MKVDFINEIFKFVIDRLNGFSSSKQKNFIVKIATALRSGKNLTKSIQFVLLIENNKYIKRKLEAVLFVATRERTNKDVKLLSNLLLDEMKAQRLITHLQHSMLKSTKSSIKDVFISLAEGDIDNENFIVKIQFSLIFFSIAIFVATQIPYYAKKYLIEPMRDNIYGLAESRGMADALIYPFYLKHADIISYCGFAILILIVFLLLLYVYFYLYNTHMIYKINKLHAKYDSSYIIFNILHIHKNTGSNLTTISNILATNIYPFGVRILFQKIGAYLSSIQKDEFNNISSIFKNFGFSHNIYEAINIGEDKGINNIWPSFEHAHNEAKSDLKKINEKIIPGINKILIMLGFIFIIGVSMSCLFYNFTLNNIISRITSMM